MLIWLTIRPGGRQWLGWRDSNARNDGVKVRCLTPWLQPNEKGRKAGTALRLE